MLGIKERKEGTADTTTTRNESRELGIVSTVPTRTREAPWDNRESLGEISQNKASFVWAACIMTQTCSCKEAVRVSQEQQ